jgi:dienelactone hydrolase
MRPMKMVAAAVAALLVAGSPVAAPTHAAADSDVAITLPRPTGPYPTGTTLVHMRDESRVDPLDPAGGKRELMVQLWYPARPAPGRPLAPYAPPGEAAGLQGMHADMVPAGAFTATTHSRLGAPARPGLHKVVFFHHGICASRTDTTIVNEQLASLGYVVVALGNTHESWAVEFPGGRVVGTSDLAYCATGGDPFSEANQAILNKLLAVRVADTRFVLDRLTAGAGLPPGLAGAMDTRRVGMFGHSFGGGTAAAVMHADRRFVAGVDLDGLVVGPVVQAGLRKPFLVLGSSYHDTELDPSWGEFLPRLSGWHKWLALRDTGHYRFIDLGGSAGKWGLEEKIKAIDPEIWRLNFGDIDDARGQEIVVRLTTAFFERFLCGQPAPILDRPESFYPELDDRTETLPSSVDQGLGGRGVRRVAPSSP